MEKSSLKLICLILSSVSVSVTAKVNLTVDNWSQTRLKTIESNYLWTVSNFSLLNQDVGKYTESPLFSSDNDHYKWSLRLYPKGVAHDSLDYLSIYLMYKSGPLPSLRVNFAISLLNSAHEELETGRAKEVAMKEKTGNGWAQFYNRNSLDSEEIVIYASFTAIIGVSQTSGNCTGLSVGESSDRDFARFIDNEMYSDVALEVAGVSIRAHRIILAVQSPKFASIFESEAKRTSVEIADTELEVAREALRFMYTGKVEKLEELASKLLVFASNYQIDELKRLSERKLCQIMGFDNVIEILNLADEYDDEKLKTRAINFIAANAGKFLQMPEFKQLGDSKPKLIVEIFNVIAGYSRK